MLSYRHGFHAGNHADVLKHAVLAFCLEYLTAKPKPFFVLDTHAGAGLYDLTSEMAARTAEWRDGVSKVWGQDVPDLLVAYAQTLKWLNPSGELLDYPGSPEFIRHRLRSQDRAVLCELHPTDGAALQPDSGIEIRRADGYQTMIKALPPRERRGLVLVDPSYEIKDDYDTAPEKVIAAHRRFSTGMFILWYPVVDRDRTETMLGRLESSGIRNQLRIELAMRADDPERGMTASGLVIINPPWTLHEKAAEALPWLISTLGAEGDSYVRWLVPE